MSKKGLSDIITVVLIILVALAAIVILWSAVKSTILKGTDQLNSERLNIALSGSNVNFSQNPLIIPVTRSVGQGNISSIRIILTNSSGASCTYENSSRVPAELETVNYFITVIGLSNVNCNIANPISYEVYPVFIENGNTVIGLAASKDTNGNSNGFSNTGSSAYPGSSGYVCIPNCQGHTCDPDPVCGTRNCGPCAGTCSNGVCSGTTGNPISACGPITASGTYTLSKDITISGGWQDCIDINADNVILDLNTHSITAGPESGYGIYSSGHDSITVKNGVISGFQNGIYFIGVSNSHVIDMTSDGNSNTGIYLQQVTNTDVMDSAFCDNDASGDFNCFGSTGIYGNGDKFSDLQSSCTNPDWPSSEDYTGC